MPKSKRKHAVGKLSDSKSSLFQSDKEESGATKLKSKTGILPKWLRKASNKEQANMHSNSGYIGSDSSLIDNKVVSQKAVSLYNVDNTQHIPDLELSPKIKTKVPETNHALGEVYRAVKDKEDIIASKDAELNSYKRKYSSAFLKLCELEKEKESYQRKLAMLEDEMHERCSSLKSTIDIQTNEILELERKLEDALNNNNKLNNMLKDVSEMASRTKVAKAKQQWKINKLKSRIKSLKEERTRDRSIFIVKSRSVYVDSNKNIFTRKQSYESPSSETSTVTSAGSSYRKRLRLYDLDISSQELTTQKKQTTALWTESVVTMTPEETTQLDNGDQFQNDRMPLKQKHFDEKEDVHTDILFDEMEAEERNDITVHEIQNEEGCKSHKLYEWPILRESMKAKKKGLPKIADLYQGFCDWQRAGGCQAILKFSDIPKSLLNVIGCILDLCGPFLDRLYSDLEISTEAIGAHSDGLDNAMVLSFVLQTWLKQQMEDNTGGSAPHMIMMRILANINGIDSFD